MHLSHLVWIISSCVALASSASAVMAQAPQGSPPITPPAPFPTSALQPAVPTTPPVGTPAPAKATPAPVPAGLQPGPATVKLKVPPNAIVWVGDQKMTQMGLDRTFLSPPLEPGKAYAYVLKVAWPASNKEDYKVQQEIVVRANQISSIDFTPLAGPSNANVQQAATPPPATYVQPTTVPQQQPQRFQQPVRSYNNTNRRQF